MIKRNFSILSVFLIFVSVFAQPVKDDLQVIIDTDCGSDDLRAICLMMASPRFNIHALCASDGTLSPVEGAIKLKGLLNLFYHDGIPVLYGGSYLQNPPPFRQICKQITWGEGLVFSSDIKLSDEIKNISNIEKTKLTLVCLGSMHNIWKAYLDDSLVFSFIERIVWYNGSSNTNYNFDKASADSVIKHFSNIDIVSAGDLKYPDGFSKKLNALGSAYSIKAAQSIDQVEKLHKGKIWVWDEMAPAFMLCPAMFKKDNNNKYIFSGNEEKLFDNFCEILDVDKINESTMFYGFPTDKGLFSPDVAEIMDSIIFKNGIKEWRTGVITNELHGHLGVYSIIGVKMGLRVKEYFKSGFKDIHVETFAGTHPPLSCINDGIQVSTGSTTGQGLIKVSHDEQKRPAALFTCRGQTIEVSLKPEYINQVKKDIIKGVREYGIDSNDYWLYVRELALKYWKDWDRHVIFDIKQTEQ